MIGGKSMCDAIATLPSWLWAGQMEKPVSPNSVTCISREWRSPKCFSHSQISLTHLSPHNTQYLSN
ncbi:MAG: hypothetical protein N2235_01375 [Fischerella sp.]|nr:hypothetical protein [Fischerella sp.]